MNKTLSSSPERGTFGITRTLERRAAEGRTPENDADTQAYVDYIKTDRERKLEREQDPEWQKDNLEYDLRSTDWMVAKVRASAAYAQNLYAALCNNDFQRNAVWPILKGETWSCSWRYAGGIVADMCGTGDYIDWYCSGISNGDEPDVYGQGLDLKRKGFVPESLVTDEICQDLLKLGWQVVDHLANKLIINV